MGPFSWNSNQNTPQLPPYSLYLKSGVSTTNFDSFGFDVRKYVKELLAYLYVPTWDQSCQGNFNPCSWVGLPTCATGPLDIYNTSGGGVQIRTANNNKWFFSDGGDLYIPRAIYFPDGSTLWTSNGYNGIQITDGTNTLNNVISLYVSGGTISGTSPSALMYVVGGGGGGTSLSGIGYAKVSGTTISYISSIPNADLLNSQVTIQGLSVSLGNAINPISGLGFVKVSGTTLSYDNTFYYPASNPSGFTSNIGNIVSLNTLTASAQTFINDTNVTIISSGSGHTLVWSGLLPISRGGTNASSATSALTNLGAQAQLSGIGYAKISGTTVNYISSIPNADLTNSSITVQGISVNLGGSVVPISGTGFVKATGSAITYDNSTYITSNGITNLNTGQLAIAGSSTTLTSSISYSSTPSALTIAQFDTNKNISANNMIDGYTTTATAAGTTTLTVGSTGIQYFTGTTTQTVVLPSSATMSLGQQFIIVNKSTGTLTINSSGGNLVQTLTSNQFCTITCILTSGTNAASWDSMITASSSSTLSSLLGSTASNTIDNADYPQTWSWNSLTNNTGLALLSNSTAASSNTQTLFSASLTGINASTNQTTYAASFSNAHNQANGTNIALKLSATNNIVGSNIGFISDAWCGINTTLPKLPLHVRSNDIPINGSSANSYPTFNTQYDNVLFEGARYALVHLMTNGAANSEALFIWDSPSTRNVAAYGYDYGNTATLSSSGFLWTVGGTTIASLNSTGLSVGNSTTTATAFSDIGASTTSQASLRIRSGSAPTSPNNGDVWNDSTQKSLHFYTNGVKTNMPGVLFTQTATATVANTLTETSILSTGVGTKTLPTNFFVAGKTIRVRVEGYVSNVVTPTIQIKVKLGSTVILDTTAVTMTTITGSRRFSVEGTVTCRTNGASGTIFSQGEVKYFSIASTANFIDMVNTTTTTIDTTITQIIDVTCTWGTANASNTISSTDATIQILN